jgi:hypothetical protein
MYLIDKLKSMDCHTKKRIRSIVRKSVRMIPFFINLNMLALINGTDKLAHDYISKYQKHFKSIRNRRMKILEIGIGGYDDPQEGGESLRLWSDYFKKSFVYGIDIADKKPHEEKRIKTFKGSQNDPEYLSNFAKMHGPFDVIIDDGSHVSEHIITSFKVLFPYLKMDGIYVVEDLYTSYWPQLRGWQDKDDNQTSLDFFKILIDTMNYEFIPNHSASIFDGQIKSIIFYPKIVFIFKGLVESGKLPAMEEEFKKAEKILIETR